MPAKTLKNKKTGARIIKFQGSPVPIVFSQNTKRGITYKLPANLLEPKDLLRAKQKNKANAAKLAEEVRRTRALEAERLRKERLESQARFAALVRAERDRQAAESSMLLKAFENNNVDVFARLKRGPGARSSSTARTIPPNLLRLMRGNVTPLPAPKPNLVSLLGSASGNRTVRKANVLKATKKLPRETSNSD